MNKDNLEKSNAEIIEKVIEAIEKKFGYKLKGDYGATEYMEFIIQQTITLENARCLDKVKKLKEDYVFMRNKYKLDFCDSLFLEHIDKIFGEEISGVSA